MTSFSFYSTINLLEVEGSDYIMCGIVGFVGKDKAIHKLIHGLKTLEYRGYDSAGVAI